MDSNVFKECMSIIIIIIIRIIITRIIIREGGRSIRPINVLAFCNVLSVAPFFTLYLCTTLFNEMTYVGICILFEEALSLCNRLVLYVIDRLVTISHSIGYSLFVVVRAGNVGQKCIVSRMVRNGM